MNKFLLLALMLSLGVLAYALGLFSKDSSTALSQYVPDSVGEMFSKTKDQKTTAINKDQNNSDDNTNSTIAVLAMPEPVDTSSDEAASITNLEEKQLNTLKTTDEASKDALIEIPDDLIIEIQQGLSPEASPETMAIIKQQVKNIDSENQALKEKLISLNEQSKESDGVLEEIEKKLKESLNAQNEIRNEHPNELPSEENDLLKELEKQIQSLNH